MNPLYEQTTIFHLFDYLFWLKRIPIHQLTQNLCYNVPFHLYIHDQGLQQTFTTLPCRVNMYETPLYEQLYFTYSVTFFGSNEYQFNQLKIYVLTFLSTSTFMIKAYNKHSLHFLVG